MASKVIDVPLSKYIAIKLSHFDIKYIFIKIYNEHLMQIAYRSPSIFLDGIYLTVPTEVISSSKLYHTRNHLQKIILIKTDDRPLVKKWCEILQHINDSLKISICGKDSNYMEIDYIEKLWSSSEHIAPSLKTTGKHERFKPFIKSHTTQNGEDLVMLIINNYNLNENHDTFSLQVEAPIVFYVKEINHYYHNYYCRTSLSYKNL